MGYSLWGREELDMTKHACTRPEGIFFFFFFFFFFFEATGFNRNLDVFQ